VVMGRPDFCLVELLTTFLARETDALLDDSEESISLDCLDSLDVFLCFSDL